jgi:hypothetical protein
MEIVPATPEQIAAFKLAAAKRYADLGVEPKIANQLFEIKMATIAEDLGMVEEDPIEKLADSLADAMGRERTKEAGLGKLISGIGKRVGKKALKSTGKKVLKGTSKVLRRGAKTVEKGTRRLGKATAKGVRKVTKGKLPTGDLRRKGTQLAYGAGTAAAGAAGVGGAAGAASGGKREETPRYV